MTLNPTSSNFNPLFPSRSLPLNLSELTMELARLPTRDLIAKGQGFFVQIGDPDSRGRREVKTWMEIDEYNTSSSVVMRSLSDFELLQEQVRGAPDRESILCVRWHYPSSSLVFFRP